MKKLKNIFIILTLLFFILIFLANQKVFASNPANLFQKVEYSEEFQKWLELSDEERMHVMQPRMYDILSTDNISKNPLYKASMLSTSIYPKYSLKDIIPSNLSIRNQKQTNSCWTFAALSSLETNIALSNYKKQINTSKVYDFSERHMEYATSKTFSNGVENKIGYDRNVGDGGNWYFAESYLTNGSGAINESEMPFENNENTIDINNIQNKTVSSTIYDTIDFTDYRYQDDEKKAETMNQIKQHIQNSGSVFAYIHGGSSNLSAFNCYNNDTGAKYCNGSIGHPIDHAISIIGWDDNYSVDNFDENAKPTSNGAWIVRNSWGEREEYKLSELKEEIFNTYQQQCIEMGWNSAAEIPNEFIQSNGYTIENDMVYKKIGDNGLIYVSYEDRNISSNMYGIIKATDTVDYETIYQYDEYYPANQLNISTGKIMLCNVFDRKTTNTEYLTHISLYAPETYTCKVYVNPNGSSKSKNDLQFVPLKTGESETFNAGYHTLEFSKPIEISGDSFCVVVEIQRDYAVAVSLETKVDRIEWFNSVTVEKGKCFVATGDDLANCQWMDLGALTEINSSLTNGDSTIKAFTTSELFDGSLKNIEITTPPAKTTYFEGEDFDKTGMVVKANYHRKTNPSVTLDPSSYTIANGTNLKAGQTSVTITYEDKSIEQAITVEKNNITELTIKAPPTKIEYKEGQNFDKTGMIIEATYQDGTTKIVSDYTIIDGNNLKNGQTKVTIFYHEKTVEQPIKVTPNPLIEIKVTKAPYKTQYIVGENFDKTGMIITGTYQDGETHKIIDYIIENGTNLTKEQSFVTIKYEEKITTQAITVGEKAENSNLDNAKCDVKKVEAYYYTDNSQQNYTLINLEINNISRILTNDTVTYYYYLSTNNNEQNIDKWIKITNPQNSKDSLEFTIDSRNVSNYAEIASEDVVYLYIKEIAKKGEDQSVAISKSMKLETDKKIETYVNNVKKEDLQIGGSDTNTSGDSTMATNKLPNAGINLTLIAFMVVILGIGIYAYLNYKNLNHYLK